MSISSIIAASRIQSDAPVPIAYKSHTVKAQTGVSTITPDKPTCAVGDLLRVLLMASAARTWTIPSGWFIIPGVSAGTLSVPLYRVVDGTEGSTFSFSCTGGTANLRAGMVCHEGVDPTDPFDVSSFLQGAAGTSLVLPQVNVADGTYLDSLAYRNASVAALTKPASMTQDFQNLSATNAFHGAHEDAVPGNSGTRTWSWTGTSVVAGVLCALRPAA